MSHPSHRAFKLVWLPLGIVAVTTAVFFGSWGAISTLDSRHFLADKRVTGCDFAAIFSTDYWDSEKGGAIGPAGQGLYRPVTLSVLALLRRATSEDNLGGHRSIPINVANLVLHLAGAVLRYLLIVMLLAGRPRRELWAGLGALAGAIHPVSTEAVCTAVGLAETLSVLGVTVSLAAAVGYWKVGGLIPLIAHVLALAVALLSKEGAAVVVLVLPLLAWVSGRRGTRALFLAWMPCLAVTGAWLGLRWLVLGSLGSVGDPVYAGFPIGERIATALAVIGSYDLPALVWPAVLLPYVSFSDVAPARGFGDARALGGLAVVLVWAVGSVLAWRKDRVAGFGLLFFGLAFLPVSNLVTSIGAVAGTRFLYLPWLGLSIALGALWSRTSRAGSLVGAIALVWFLPIMAGFTVMEVPVWQSPESLFEEAVNRSPTPAAWRALATARMDRGERAAALVLLHEAATMQPVRIPGTERFTRRSLSVAYQSALEAAQLELRETRNANAALVMAEQADLYAVSGLRQSEQGPWKDMWKRRRSQALSLQGTLHFGKAQKEPEMSARLRDTRRGEACLEQALAFTPKDWTARLRFLVRHQLRGEGARFQRELAQLYGLARPHVARDRGALEAVLAYGAHLMDRGQHEEGLRIRLEAAMAGIELLLRSEVVEISSSVSEGDGPELYSLAKRLRSRLTN